MTNGTMTTLACKIHHPETAMPTKPDRAFLAVCALVLAAGTLATIAWCSSMSAMGGMDMPGGWTMSMTWMLMPDQSWLGAGSSFLAMWMTMMIPMMLPSLVPMLRRYRRTVGGMGTGQFQLSGLTLLVALGYFLVWALVGAIVFPLGVALAEATMQAPALSLAVPYAIAIVVLLASLFQVTAWKARYLACCRGAAGHDRPSAATVSGALRHGLGLGGHCLACCGALMLVLVVLGIMDLGVMAAITAVISLERLAPGGERIAKVIGVVGIVVWLYLIAQVAGM